MHSSVPVAELIAAWMGVQEMVPRLGAGQAWIEGDSITVINWLNNPASSTITYNPILKEIAAWKASRVVCHISHIQNEANQATDYMTNRALQLQGVYVSWGAGDGIDHVFANILQNDDFNGSFI